VLHVHVLLHVLLHVHVLLLLLLRLSQLGSIPVRVSFESDNEYLGWVMRQRRCNPKTMMPR